MKKKKISSIALLLVIILIVSMFVGCGRTAEQVTEDAVIAGSATEVYETTERISSLNDLTGKKVGVLTGSVNEANVKLYVPDCQIVYFNAVTDLAVALSTGKIDAFAEDESTERFILKEYPNLCYLAKLCDCNYGSFFPKTDEGQVLCDQLNDFLAEIRADGTMAEIDALWFEADDDMKVVDFSGLTGENGTLSMAISSSVAYPFAYVKDGDYVGYDVDIAIRFCREYGYDLTLENYDFAGVLAAVSSGKCDFGGCGVTITEERAESVLFSDPTYYSGSFVVVRGEDASEETVTAETATDTAAAAGDAAVRFAGKKIGVITGSVFDGVAAEHLPKSTVEYINSSADIALALETGRIDAYIADEPTVRMIQKSYDEQYISANLEDIAYGFVFQKGGERSDQIRGQLDAFLTELKQNGTLDEMYGIWLGDDESKKNIDYSGMTGKNGEVTFAVSTDVGAPFAYVKYDQYAGYDVDIAVRFCKAYGYSLKISDYSFSGMLASVAGGKCDFGASSIVMTEERKESMNFSVPNYEGSIVLATKDRQETDTTLVSDVREYNKLSGLRIAVLTGTIIDVIAQELIPECQVEMFNTNADLALSLETGKVDAYMTDQPVARMLLDQYPDQHVFGVVSQDSYAYAFPKNSQRSDLLRAQMNGFLEKLCEEKTLREIDNIWFGNDESAKVVDFSGLTGVNGELSFAVSSGVGAPFCYLKDDQYAGYDVDIAVRFCREYGYGLKIVDSDFAGIIAAVSSGKCDFGASCITVTEERMESMNFSDPNYDGGIVVVIRDMQLKQGKSRADQLKAMTGKRIGVLVGGWCGAAAEQSIPECKVEYFNTNSDMALALDTGKIDAYMTDEPVARKLIATYPDQQIYVNVLEDHYGIIFRKDDPKSDALRLQMNEFIAAYKADGTAEEMEKIWFGSDPAIQTVDFSGLTGENGTLNFAISSGVGEPFSYMKDGSYAGFDVDLIARFCRAYGYALNISDSDFSGVMTAVTSGKCDLGASSISITEERQMSMNFSDSYYDNNNVLVVRGDGVGAAAEDSSDQRALWQSIKDSFGKTFLRENRWQLFAGGIGVTLLITVVSALCGTVVGFLAYLIYRKNYLLPNVVVNILSDILQKTPVVVILMILYYLVFGKASLDGMWVSCIGFSLIFACAVTGLLTVAVGAVDGGQMEAALALGYTDTRAFLIIILPQALRHFLPGYRSEIVALIKGTAIVGYIAVQDLTKISDIVRSRTYEAFFPLIASAVIYFAIAWILTLLVRRLQIRIDPKRRSDKKVMKGVQTK